MKPGLEKVLRGHGLFVIRPLATQRATFDKAMVEEGG
jgi:hypothetical protein